MFGKEKVLNENIKEVEKLNAWISKHQKDFIKAKANIEDKSISAIIRQCIELYENQESLNTNIDRICEILDKQIDRSFKKNLDRVIKLVVKAVISAESSNHNTAQILSSMKRIDINEVKETAYHYATNYLQRKNGGDLSE